MVDKLCVAYGADDNYAKYLGISLLSLFRTNTDFAEIYVFVLDCGIGEANKEKLLYIADKYNRKIEFIEMKDMEGKLNLNMGFRKISIASYARLFLSSVITDTYKRFLYLDCDTLILDKVNKLWNIKLNNYLVAGVQDTVDRFYLIKIGLNIKNYYINAGVLLINLEAWRQQKLEQKFMDFIRRFRGNVPHHDQGIINAVCHNKVHILSLRYNVNSNIYSYSARSISRLYYLDIFYSQREINMAKENPIILHYTEGLVGRPWEENCTHPLKDKFLQIKDLSPWNMEPIQADSRNMTIKAFTICYKYMPLFVSESIYKISNWLIHLRDKVFDKINNK
ncbi:MAG: glycosyltransferase family 8 protein [Bacillota bacterium]|nr:glycosyltransferase family 8 protein [Bacillota bacterium]